jgi:S-adenosylmethionine-diacylglycerol 3-amino-3-carboxypropyl transferase
MNASITAPIQSRVRFDLLRYANCWEDATVLARSLAPLGGARCLSIASAGDNTFSLLARGAASVRAVDLSPAQLALVELKMAAFRHLTHEELLEFLGIRPHRSRRAVYRQLQGSLGTRARAFWDARQAAVEAGVIHAGRLETYFRMFRRWVLPLVHGRATVTALLTSRDPRERHRFYEEMWDSWRWRLLFRLFFGRRMMGRFGRDREFFRYVDGPVASRILRRTRFALETLPSEHNPFLRYILTGSFDPAPPDYLRPEHYGPIREGLGRVILNLAPVEEVLNELPPRSIDAFNLSNIPEYMSLAGYHQLLERVHRVAAPGARLAYWNVLAPRRRPESMATWLEARDEQAGLLHREALAFFYEAFVLEVTR